MQKKLHFVQKVVEDNYHVKKCMKKLKKDEDTIVYKQSQLIPKVVTPLMLKCCVF